MGGRRAPSAGALRSGGMGVAAAPADPSVPRLRGNARAAARKQLIIIRIPVAIELCFASSQRPMCGPP